MTRNHDEWTFKNGIKKGSDGSWKISFNNILLLRRLDSNNGLVRKVSNLRSLFGGLIKSSLLNIHFRAFPVLNSLRRDIFLFFVKAWKDFKNHRPVKALKVMSTWCFYTLCLSMTLLMTEKVPFCEREITIYYLFSQFIIHDLKHLQRQRERVHNFFCYACIPFFLL